MWAKADRLRIVPEPVDKANPDAAGFALPLQELNRTIGTRQQHRKIRDDVDVVERQIPLQSVLDADHLKAATHFGLTISRIRDICGAAQERCHPPPEHRLAAGACRTAPHGPCQGRACARAVLEPGSVAHAAVSQVLDRLASMREREKTWEGRGMMVMWGAATLLAFFTDGATLYGASLVQAAFSAHEIYDSGAEYQNEAALAAVRWQRWRKPAGAARRR